VVSDRLTTPVQLGRSLKEFEAYLASRPTEAARQVPVKRGAGL